MSRHRKVKLTMHQIRVTQEAFMLGARIRVLQEMVDYSCLKYLWRTRGLEWNRGGKRGTPIKNQIEYLQAIKCEEFARVALEARTRFDEVEGLMMAYRDGGDRPPGTSIETMERALRAWDNYMTEWSEV